MFLEFLNHLLPASARLHDFGETDYDRVHASIEDLCNFRWSLAFQGQLSEAVFLLSGPSIAAGHVTWPTMR